MELLLWPINEVNLIPIVPPNMIIIDIKIPFAKKIKAMILLAISQHVKYIFKKKDYVVRSNKLHWVAS